MKKLHVDVSATKAYKNANVNLAHDLFLFDEKETWVEIMSVKQLIAALLWWSLEKCWMSAADYTLFKEEVEMNYDCSWTSLQLL